MKLARICMQSKQPDGNQHTGKNESLEKDTTRTENDAELIKAYVERDDQGAFAEIVSRHGSMVYRVCFRKLLNRPDISE